MTYNNNNRIGYINGSVFIGEYTFIGESSIIFPGVKIGKGCLIKAGSVVNSSFPDFTIISGSPAKAVGNIVDLDKNYFNNKIVRKTYFDKQLLRKHKH